MDEDKCVYVSEDLPQLRSRLLSVARKTYTVKNAIMRDGRIICFLKDARQDRPVTIENPDDVFHLGYDNLDGLELEKPMSQMNFT